MASNAEFLRWSVAAWFFCSCRSLQGKHFAVLGLGSFQKSGVPTIRIIVCWGLYMVFLLEALGFEGVGLAPPRWQDENRVVEYMTL